MKKVFLGVAALAVFFLAILTAPSFATESKTIDELTTAAKRAVQDRGYVLEDVDIIYDEGNKRWEEWGAIVEKSPADPNHGMLPKGILEKSKYTTVYFDFIDDAKKDIWAFVNPDTGEILEIYVQK
jgi:hypothetical protein